MFNGSAVGRITTAGVATYYPISEGFFPLGAYGIAAGPDGALWFPLKIGVIGRITTNGVFTEYLLPTESDSEGIAAGPDGALWFTFLQDSAIEDGAIVGRITTAGAFTDYMPSTSNVSNGIAAGPDGALWFTESGKIGRITPAGAISEFSLPANGAAGAITAGPDGALWFTVGNNIGRITTAGAVTEFTVPTANSGLAYITAGPDGKLWFTEASSNKIGRITTAGAITEYAVPTANSRPWGIVSGPDGALWFTEINGNRIGRVAISTAAGPTISAAALPIGEVGFAYSATLSASGGTPPYSNWAVSSGSLPKGVGLIPSTGVIAGSPTSVGAFSFGVTVQDSAGVTSAAQSFSVTVSQQVCHYSLSSGGQSLSAAGGTGSISVTAGAGCVWTVMGAPSWVTISSGSTGSGDGTANFQVAPNTGGPLSAVLTIAGQTFTLEQVAAAGSIAGLTAVGSLGQVNAQGGWSFELDAVNLGASAATAQVNFTDPNGNPLIMPLTFPQTSPTALPELAATLDRTINPNARVVINSSGLATAATLLGSGQLLSNGSVSGFGIFSFPAFNWNAVVPLETRKGSTYSLPFDNTGVLTTGVAVSNITTSPTSANVTILSDAGVPIGSDTINLTAQGFQQFLLPTKYPQTFSARGTIQFQTTSPGQISVLGVRANGTAALTTLPVLSNVDLPGGSISDLTYGAGFISTFYLVNTGTAPASFTLSFYNQSGAPVSAPLSLPQTTSTQTTQALTQTLVPGQMLEVATQASAAALANVSGSAQLATTGSIGGFEIFDFLPNGQEASVPLETRTPKNFVLVYDNTNGLTTGVALANAGSAAANITANIYDDQGNLLQSLTISLAGYAQQTIVLNSSYTVTANKRGMVQFVVPTTGAISMIGIRVGTSGATTTTTIPILTQ